MKWVNFGGGPSHYADRIMMCPDLERLRIVRRMFMRHCGAHGSIWSLGEAVASKCWITCVTSVLEMLVENENEDLAILDTSAACHMPDVLEMPYRPPLRTGSGLPEEKPYTYRLGGPTCLAGDIIGDYSFDDAA